MMIGSQLGIGILEATRKEWKLSVLAMIFATANTIIFWPKGTDI